MAIPVSLLSAAVDAQVSAYDARFRRGLQEAGAVVDANAQGEAFGKRDATGVEAVHDVMPTETEVFEQLLDEAVADTSGDDAEGSCAITVLDFGCGDGRYLKQYLRSAEALQRKCGRVLRVVAYDVSLQALLSFQFQALNQGLSQSSCSGSHTSPSEAKLKSLEGNNLQLEFLHGCGLASSEDVVKLVRASAPLFNIAVFGWGTLSCIPRLPQISAEALLREMARCCRRVMNVVSSTNNHVKFQHQYEALRRALAETQSDRARTWLQSRVRLATFANSYYYRVDTGEDMFYAAITAEAEASRLRECGFGDVEIRICNIINFFDIQTKPRAARLNAAVIRLLERGDAWGAQHLLSCGVARATGRPLSSLRQGSCIFDTSSGLALKGQVARYFISTGRSECCAA